MLQRLHLGWITALHKLLVFSVETGLCAYFSWGYLLVGENFSFHNKHALSPDFTSQQDTGQATAGQLSDLKYP
jgi:hypothetical protein